MIAPGEGLSVLSPPLRRLIELYSPAEVDRATKATLGYPAGWIHKLTEAVSVSEFLNPTEAT